MATQNHNLLEMNSTDPRRLSLIANSKLYGKMPIFVMGVKGLFNILHIILAIALDFHIIF